MPLLITLSVLAVNLTDLFKIIAKFLVFEFQIRYWYIQAAQSYLRCKTKSWFKIFPRVLELDKVRTWYKLAWFIHNSFFIARRPRDDISLNLKSAVFWKPEIPWKVPDALKFLCQGRYSTLIELYLISYNNKKEYQNILTYCLSLLPSQSFIFWCNRERCNLLDCKYFTDRRALEPSLLSQRQMYTLSKLRGATLASRQSHVSTENDAEQS